MAVASGVADVVVCYRAFNERSGHRFGTGVQGRAPVANAENAHFSWYAPQGLLTPASWVAMFAQRYLHATGATTEDFGRVAVADRAFAATNPAAWFYGKPITLEDHQASRWIVEPLRLLDCCQESDGGQAIVVTSLERARDGARAPAVIEAAAQGSGAQQDMMTSYYRDDMTRLPEMGVVARQLWETSGLGPDDMQCAVLYDHFTPFVLYQLEELGFCEWGEAKEFLRDGHIRPGRQAAHQHPRRPTGRGLHPRDERHRRRRAPGAGQRREPGRGGRARRRHRRHRRPHQRAGPGRRPPLTPYGGVAAFRSGDPDRTPVASQCIRVRARDAPFHEATPLTISTTHGSTATTHPILPTRRTLPVRDLPDRPTSKAETATTTGTAMPSHR